MDFALIRKKYNVIGTDEVGRGPIAGPVVACASFFSNESEKNLKKLKKLGVTDSKKLSSVKRQLILKALGIEIKELVSEKIYKTPYFSFMLTEEPPRVIDEINILQASLKCMKRASDHFVKENTYLLVDGNKLFETSASKIEAVIKGDSKSLAIAIASIIAKEFRDEKMRVLGLTYPQHGFENHAGYPTKKHLMMIETLGVTPEHRQSYAPVKAILERNSF